MVDNNQITFDLTKSGENGLDIWYKRGNVYIPIYHMVYRDILPYARENSTKITSSEDTFPISDIPYLIKDYFFGHEYKIINSFFKLFLHDVVNTNLEKILEEKGIKLKPIQECDIKLRFSRSFQNGLVQEVIL